MNGLFQAGAFVGSIGINVVADRFGRKMSIIVPSLLVLISGACLAGSVNVGMFIAFRFFSGMGSWWLLGSVPVWMSEVAPPKNRGVLVDCHSAANLAAVAAHLYLSEKRLPLLTGQYLCIPTTCDPEALPAQYKDAYVSREQNKHHLILNQKSIDMFESTSIESNHAISH